LGLSIVQDRLDFFTKKYKSNFEVSIHDLTDEASGKAFGTQVVVTLPKLIMENYKNRKENEKTAQ
jgi:hypothetical protein